MYERNQITSIYITWINNLFLGGTLRIYADSLKPNIPYKTILLSTTDTADFAVIEALEKYSLEKENPKDYCIARVSKLMKENSVKLINFSLNICSLSMLSHLSFISAI